MSTNPPSTKHQSSLNDSDYAIVDSGASVNYLYVQEPVLNKVLIDDGATVILPDDNTIKACYKGTLDILSLPLKQDHVEFSSI